MKTTDAIDEALGHALEADLMLKRLELAGLDATTERERLHAALTTLAREADDIASVCDTRHRASGYTTEILPLDEAIAAVALDRLRREREKG